MSKKLLQVEHLSIALKNPYQELVKDISFSLEEAGAVILLGQSGSGKTMTCRAILGLLNSSAFQVNGEILFENRSLLQLKEKERAVLWQPDCLCAAKSDDCAGSITENWRSNGRIS